MGLFTSCTYQCTSAPPAPRGPVPGEPLGEPCTRPCTLLEPSPSLQPSGAAQALSFLAIRVTFPAFSCSVWEMWAQNVNIFKITHGFIDNSMAVTSSTQGNILTIIFFFPKPNTAKEHTICTVRTCLKYCKEERKRGWAQPCKKSQSLVSATQCLQAPGVVSAPSTLRGTIPTSCFLPALVPSGLGGWCHRHLIPARIWCCDTTSGQRYPFHKHPSCSLALLSKLAHILLEQQHRNTDTDCRP